MLQEDVRRQQHGAERIVRAAVAQDAPVPFAIGQGIARLIDRVGDAADAGAEIVAFGEALLGGYPVWLDATLGTATASLRGAQALHAILLDHALRPADPRLEPLQALVDATGMLASFGASTRLPGELVGTHYLFRPGRPPLQHHKRVPRRGEGLLWAPGDGASQRTHAADWGGLAQHFGTDGDAPLAGEAVHIAAWPDLREADARAVRRHARAGQCHVLAAALVQHRDELLIGLELVGNDPHARALLLTLPDAPLLRGGSLIAAPDGSALASATVFPELLVADLEIARQGGAMPNRTAPQSRSRSDTGVEWI